jgi:glutaredoxin 3
MEFKMTPVIIYTRNGCPYCTSALALLTKKGAKFTEYNANVNAAYRAEMMEKSSRNTFPQIFIGTTHVGGCDDLHALDARGGLDKLLAG